MLRLVADENFDERIVDGVRQRLPGFDCVAARDVGLARTPDPIILEWAANAGRLVLTHDVHTMIAHARERIQRGQPMPGLIVIHEQIPIRRAVDELEIFLACSAEGEYHNQIIWLPL